MKVFRASLRSPRFLAIWVATALLFALAFVLAPGSVSASSLETAFSFAAILAIASIGQTLVVQQGGLDLTVPGVISLAAVIVTKFPAGDDTLLLSWGAMAIVAGALSGVLCGIAIVGFLITPLVATLAVNALLYGVVLYLTRGTSTQAVPPALSSFALTRVWGLPSLALVAIIAIVIVEVFIQKTIWGRTFVSIGTSRGAARAAAMRVSAYTVATYVVAGVSYAIAGILLSGYLEVPSLMIGKSYLLPTVAAVVLGGTSLLGGVGSVAASAAGALFLVQLEQETLGMGAPTSVQGIIEALIIAVGMALRLVPWREVLGRAQLAQASDNGKVAARRGTIDAGRDP
jgi:ribose transport system permease protein